MSFYCFCAPTWRVDGDRYTCGFEHIHIALCDMKQPPFFEGQLVTATLCCCCVHLFIFSHISLAGEVHPLQHKNKVAHAGRSTWYPPLCNILDLFYFLLHSISSRFASFNSMKYPHIQDERRGVLGSARASRPGQGV